MRPRRGWVKFHMMKATIGLWILPALLTLGCSKSGNETPEPPRAEAVATNAPAPATPEGPTEYAVKGVIQRIEAEDLTLVVKHEAIPGYMPAMVMPFEVRNAAEMAGLEIGDEITFAMMVTETDGWIERLKKTGVNVPIQAQPTRLVRDVEPLNEGDLMTNYPFTNSLGTRFELADFAGKAYALTFIFTRCPFPEFCPKMNNNIQKAYDSLSADSAISTNWAFVSLSFDPDFDTPEQLASYSSRYKRDPLRWQFATGAMVEIDAITEQFGLAFVFRDGTYDHKLRTVVVDPKGRIQKILIGNQWTGDELAAEMRKALSPG